jgi:hypothetical protein
VTVLESRPSIDDRFAVGYCACQPQPVVSNARKRLPDRPVVQLIRRDLFTGVVRPRTVAEKRRQEKQALNGSELW